MHLAQKARWWKFARENHSSHLGPAVLAWNLTQQECRYVEKCASKIGLSQVPKLEDQAWFADLTEEGIEPNPGPSFQGVTLNCNGGERAWLAAQHYMDLGFDFICLQELNYSLQKTHSFMRMAHNRKYHAHVASGDPKTNIAGRQHWHGGVTILTPFRHPTRLIETWHTEDAQLVHVEVCKVHVLGVYCRPACLDPETMWNKFHETLQSLKCRHWVMLGDWNVEPTENPLLNLGHNAKIRAVKTSDYDWCPTRWNGTRCIDYCLANHWICQPSFDSVAWADHRAVKFEGAFKTKTCDPSMSCDAKTWKKPKTFSCPNGYTLDDWRNALETAWKTCPEVPAGTADQQWETFNKMASFVHIHAEKILRHEPLDPVLDLAAFLDTPHVSKGQKPRFGCFNYTPKACANFKMRKLRRDLGRLHEAQRAPSEDANKLICKVRGRRPQLCDMSLPDSIRALEAELIRAEHDSREQANQKWRDNMCSHLQRRNAWIKDSGFTCPVQVKYNGNTASHPADAIETLRDFWNQIWHRPVVQTQSAYEAWTAVIQPGEELEALPWTPFCGVELSAQAQRMKHGAAGLDGWTGDELSCWPMCAWEQYARLANEWFESQCFPRQWCDFRQIHIPKQALHSKPHCPADKLRPIVVESALWRVLASVWVRRTATQAWVQNWVPSQAFGGIKQRSVEKALAEFHTQFEQPETAAVVNLDLAKCFDNVSVDLALKCLNRLGMPAPMITACEHIWKHQRRFLQYRRCTSTDPAIVENSLPQGDALSVLALLALLSMPTRDIQRRAENNGWAVKMITFVDDRSFLCQNASQAMTMIRQWDQWSQTLGLVENEDKIRVVVHKPQVQQDMLALGARKEWFEETTRILGIDFDYRAAPECPTALARVHTCRERIQRIAVLPLGQHVKMECVRSVALPLASWGCWFFLNMKTWHDLQKEVRKCLGLWHSPASRELFSILSGHQLDAAMSAIHSSISTLYRVVSSGSGPQWHRLPRLHTWQQCVNRQLAKCGWNIQESWVWRHPTCGQINMLNGDDMGAAMHRFRESWRRSLFEKWTRSQRRELSHLHAENFVYNQYRIELVRKTYKKGDAHVRAVLTAGAVSDACYAITLNQEPENHCNHCNAAVVPTWYHACWECEAFADGRPELPSDPLQLRLGWNLPSPADESIIVHMARVRKHLLSNRRA